MKDTLQRAKYLSKQLSIDYNDRNDIETDPIQLMMIMEQREMIDDENTSNDELKQLLQENNNRMMEIESDLNDLFNILLKNNNTMQHDREHKQIIQLIHNLSYNASMHDAIQKRL